MPIMEYGPHCPSANAGRRPSRAPSIATSARCERRSSWPGQAIGSRALRSSVKTRRACGGYGPKELLVLDTMPAPFREIARLAALTLMRMTEIGTLRREFVHLEQGVVMLPQAKAGARAVVLSASARKILQTALEGHSGELVFPGSDGRPYSREQIGKVFRRSARAAGLRDFHFHDLRHHGATMALNKGCTAPIVMALGGWKTERMMRRYAAVTDSTLRAAAEAVSGNEPWQHVAKYATQNASA
jgi:integrase